MKVSVVTGFTPTEENVRGISGLIYALIKYRPEDVDLKIYSYNLNRISEEEIKKLEKELHAHIILVRKPYWMRIFDNTLMGHFNKFCMRLPMVCYEISEVLVNQLREDHPDFVWVYPYFYYRLAKRMPEQKFVVTGCDCEALIRVRSFETKKCLLDSKALRHNYLMLKKGLRFENEWNLPNVKVHFVGMEDMRFYERTYGYHNASFLLHPHYRLMDKTIRFDGPKIKIIVAGSYDVYTQDDVDEMLPNLIRYKDLLSQYYEFTFLGRNWEPVQEKLEAEGVVCTFKSWVEDYAKELVSHDIQLTPISFGTGTKGKVLSALANGLLVVGSKYAFDNICVRNGDSCICYKKASDIAFLLMDLAKDRERCIEIAGKGRSQVRTYHCPKRISRRFFNIFNA